MTNQLLNRLYRNIGAIKAGVTHGDIELLTDVVNAYETLESNLQIAIEALEPIAKKYENGSVMSGTMANSVAKEALSKITTPKQDD